MLLNFLEAKQVVCCLFSFLNILLFKKVKEAMNATISEKLLEPFSLVFYTALPVFSFCTSYESRMLHYGWYLVQLQSSHLSMQAHDDHRVGLVTNQKLLGVLGKRNHIVDRHVRRRWRTSESVNALARFHVPDLKRYTIEATRVFQETPSLYNTTNDVLQVDCCTLTFPSEDALMMWEPSRVKEASFTNDEWPFNSFSVFPDLSSWILKKMTSQISWMTAALTDLNNHLTGKLFFSYFKWKRVAARLFLAPVEWLSADKLNHDKTPHACWCTLCLGRGFTICGEYFFPLSLSLGNSTERNTFQLCAWAHEVPQLHPHSTCASNKFSREAQPTPQQEAKITFNPPSVGRGSSPCVQDVKLVENKHLFALQDLLIYKDA